MELFKIKQTGSYDEFFAKFQQLATESELAEDDLILLFSNALKPKCGLEVQIREPKTIEEAYKIAAKYEVNFGKLKGAEPNHKANMVNKYQNNNGNRSNRWMEKRGQNEGRSNDGKWKKNDYKKSTGSWDKKKIKCYNCNRHGHTSRDCRSPRKLRSTNFARITEEKSDSENEYANAVVLMAGPNKLLMSDGKINGKESKRILFDTGSTSSIISLKYALKHDIKFVPDNSNVRLANNMVSKVNGQSEKAIEINKGGKIDKVKMLVLENNEFDVLLSMDYFFLSDACIYPKRRIIKFGEYASLIIEYSNNS